MNILEKIIAHKWKEVAEKRASLPVKQLEQSNYFGRQSLSLKEFITRKESSGIIAEFKRKSPSKGIINALADLQQTTTGYVRAGVSALSILTDTEFFGGENNDLTLAREINSCPILRKDFTVDEYQVVEAKSIGADVILLIVAVLSPLKIRALHEFAKSLGLEVLVEVHSKEELLIAIDSGAELIGVNNRNLKTFEVNVNLSKELSGLMPNEVVKISESGISSVDTILELKNVGYKGFLMGENFMKNKFPEMAAKEFIEKLKERSL